MASPKSCLPPRARCVKWHHSKPVLIIVEGVHDIEFLSRIRRVLRHADPRVIDLERLEQCGRLVFLPHGGGSLLASADRLARVSCRQFHLYDREAEPATAHRLRAAEMIHRRSGCRAFVTQKRALENYLHPAAIFEARGVDVTFDDTQDVAAIVAQRLWERAQKPIAWSELAPRAQHRLRAKVKPWLNTEAVAHMTLQRLAERDPQWEVLSWFTAVDQLLRGLR